MRSSFRLRFQAGRIEPTAHMRSTVIFAVAVTPGRDEISGQGDIRATDKSHWITTMVGACPRCPQTPVFCKAHALGGAKMVLAVGVKGSKD